MRKTSLLFVMCGLALAYAQQAAPATPPAAGSAVQSAPAQGAAPAAPAQTAPVQGAAPAVPAQTPAAAPSAGSFITGLLPILLIFVVFYFLLIMPQQRQRKKHVTMLAALKAGDRVVVLGGVHAIITRLKEGTIFVKIAESTEIEVDRSSVSYKAGGEQGK